MLFDAQVRTLQFAVRPRVVAKHLGLLFVPVTVLMLVPLAVWAATAPTRATLTFALVLAVMGAASLFAARLRCRDDVQTNEAMAITTLAFLLAALALAAPLAALGAPWPDAVFQSVSGITTTGLTTIVPGNGDFAFHFYCAWLQWIGGLGVLVLALALLAQSAPALRRLGASEREKEGLAGSTRTHARLVLTVYVTLTVVTLGLLLPGLDARTALLHALTAVSTGGFSSLPDSAGSLPSGWAKGVVAGACLAGAVSFSFFYRGLYRRPRELLRDEGLRALLVLVALGTAAVWLLENDSGAGAARAPADAAFMVISAQTTAGFSTVDTAALEPGSKLVLIASMLVGGDVGSTAGGIKLLRLLVLLRLLELAIATASTARRTRLAMRVEGRRVSPREVEITVAVVTAYVLLIAIGWAAFLAAGAPALDALFDVVSAVSLTGLSTGVTSPELAPWLKAVLCTGMLAGRVETVALLVVLYPRSWLGRRREGR